MITEDQFNASLCREVEATLRIEHCILFKQKGNLLCGLYHEKPVLLPVNPKSPFYMLIENKK